MSRNYLMSMKIAGQQRSHFIILLLFFFFGSPLLGVFQFPGCAATQFQPQKRLKEKHSATNR